MFYEERIIGGVLHWRNLPMGPWTPFTQEMLTTRLQKLEDAHKSLKQDLAQTASILGDVTYLLEYFQRESRLCINFGHNLQLLHRIESGAHHFLKE